MEKAAAEGKGFGPPPKQPSTTLAPRVSLHITVTMELHTLCALSPIVKVDDHYNKIFLK